jgi:Flp pilus assembly protein TadD
MRLNLAPDFRLAPIAFVGLGLTLPAVPPFASEASAQAVPSEQTQRLNRALVQVAKRPRSVNALIEAGDAALQAGDFEAALKFFTRARNLDEGNTEVDLGMAGVYLRSGRPVSALPLLAAAQATGADNTEVLTMRALALDMVGDQRGAQELYQRLLKDKPDDAQLIRALALSHAISGNTAGFEAVLRPLVEKRDFAAFRTRAFGLAIMGEQNRAAAIVDAVMPRDLARKITPYLEYMPRLTPAQQAAAANFGLYPKAENFGKDTPAIAAYAARGALPTRVAAQTLPTADERLAPVGEPLGPSAVERQGVRIVEINRPPEPAIPSAAEPGFSITRATEPPQPTRVADAFADLIAEKPPTADAPSGAVDLSAITIPIEARPEPKPQPKPKPPTIAHPSRVWVQVATGRDLAALGFDWRRLTRKSGDLLDPFKPHTVPWGEANRLLAGPVKNAAEAGELINALRAKGIETFSFTSPEGLEIQVLR